MPNTRPDERPETPYAQLDEPVRRAESLRRLVESISGELALAPLLDRILESAVELLAAQYGSIGLVVQTTAGPAVRIAAVANMPPEELGAELPAGFGLAGGGLRGQRPVPPDRYGGLGPERLPALARHALLG